jgi:hypothetical protein
MATRSESPTASRNAVASGRKNAPLQSRQHQDRQKGHRHRRGGVEHRPPYLERGPEQQRAKIRARSRAAPATRDVFHVDDGIVDHHPQGHHKPAEAHGVERQPAEAQEPHGGQERDRNGAE